MRTIGVAVSVVVVAAVAVLVSRGGTSPASKSRRQSSSLPSTPASSSPPAPVDVFAQPTVASYLTQQDDDVTAAVYDLVDGKLSLYRPGVALEMASIQKVNILETLLYQAQQQNAALSAEQVEVATGMIEESDNDDATDLWDTDGGASGVGAYDDVVGLTGTTLNTQGYWGLSTTTAADQIRLLEELVSPSSLLSPASRSFILNLMMNIDPDQDWGVSAGVPAGVAVALKNGWDPTNGIWEINSIGYVDGQGRDYLIAVLTGGNPSMASGIDTIQGLSQLVWQQLGQASLWPGQKLFTSAVTSGAASPVH